MVSGSVLSWGKSRRPWGPIVEDAGRRGWQQERDTVFVGVIFYVLSAMYTPSNIRMGFLMMRVVIDMANLISSNHSPDRCKTKKKLTVVRHKGRFRECIKGEPN